MLNNSAEIEEYILPLFHGNSVQIEVAYPNTLDETEFDEIISALLKQNEGKEGIKGISPFLIGDSARMSKWYTFPDEEKSNNFVSSINKDKNLECKGIIAGESMLKRSNFL